MRARSYSTRVVRVLDSLSLSLSTIFPMIKKTVSSFRSIRAAQQKVGRVVLGSSPCLSPKTAVAVIQAIKTYNLDYFAFPPTNSNSEYYAVWTLIKALKGGAQNVIANTCRHHLEQALKKINACEHTHVKQGDLNQIVSALAKEKCDEFLTKLENANRDYRLFETLVLLSTTKKYTSFYSKVLFNIAMYAFQDDCGYSKYDHVVSSVLFSVAFQRKYNLQKPAISSVATLDGYIEYCNYVGRLCRQFHLSRNDLDQILWLFYRQ